MYSLLFLGITAFVLSLVLTPVVRYLANRWHFVDEPDYNRKLHQVPVPRLGGIAVVLSYLLSYLALYLGGFTALRIIAGGLPLAARLAAPALVILGIGILDDLRPVKPWQKFVGQFAAASMAWFVGVRIGGLGGFAISGYWSFPATLFWIVLSTNALNLIDGLDGLATGVGIFATATTLLAALLQQNVELALVVAPLLGCLLGFLRYNFNPATIFLGDSGSLFIGFFLGCCSIIWSQKSATMLGMTAPLLALSIPLLDTGLAVVRRFLRRQPIFSADRGHIHHRLLDRGLTPRSVAVIIYGFCAVSATLSLCMMYRGMQGEVILLFCVVTWLGIQYLGYVEFGVVGKMLMSGAFRQHLNTHISIQLLERNLKVAETPEECWYVIRDSAADFGFHSIIMVLGGTKFEYRGDGTTAKQSWMVRVPLSTVDFIELSREFESDSLHSVLASFVDSLQGSIQPKLPTFQRSLAAGAGASR